MGFLQRLFQSNFFYVIDFETLKALMERDIKFAFDYNLELATDLDIYIKSEKHHINIWNASASKDKKDREKGLLFYFDEIEFKTLDEMIKEKLSNLPQYFKIDLIHGDDVELNKYKEEHPELCEFDY